MAGQQDKARETSVPKVSRYNRAALPQRAIGLALVLTSAMFIALGLQIWQSYSDLTTTLASDFQLKELQGKIVHYDEVLTMSARMGAATGQLKWEYRYNEYAPKLDVAIKQASKIAPEVFISQAAKQTDQANVKLVAIEKHAFELIRNGKTEEASALLFSSEYTQQKLLYAEGMEHVLKRLQLRSQTNLTRHRKNLYRAVAMVIFSLPVVLFIWLSVSRITRSDIAERERAAEQRRQMEAQMLHVQKLESLGVLAGGIAHDFNNLLMAILGNADLALMDIQPDSPIRESVSEIKRAALQASELARQMLAYSGKGRFVVEPINVSKLIEQMGQILRMSISKKAVLKFDLAKSLPTIEADASQIHQVIMNLVTNASEALADESGTITITTLDLHVDEDGLQTPYPGENLTPGQYVMLEVADTGCGMDAETQAKIFDPFFSTKFTGRGLGLAAVLGIIRGHNGTIKIDSDTGKGTTMQVLLPAVEAAPKPAVPDEAVKSQTNWHGSGTVLVADDEETVRTTAKTMLERLGMDVILVTNGAETIEIFTERSGEIDCVLLDLTMPYMDGEEVFGELRRIRDDIPVIMSSGYNEQDVTQRFVGRDIAGFIQKPYVLATLAQALQQALEK